MKVMAKTLNMAKETKRLREIFRLCRILYVLPPINFFSSPSIISALANPSHTTLEEKN
ncbi:hypothetical protein ES703_83923 [subsurface metagenome]